MSGEASTECEAFAAVVNAVLDGDAPASELFSTHTVSCHGCRELASAARLLASAGPGLRSLPPVPSDLTPKLVAAVRVRPRRWVPALAAGMVISGGLWLLWPTRPEGVAVGRVESHLHVSSPGTAPSATPPRVSDQLAAVTSVARTASEKASAPARLLTDFNLNSSPPALQREWSDAALAPLEKASRTTAEPVAGTARRAVGLFLRDFGLTPKPAG